MKSLLLLLTNVCLRWIDFCILVCVHLVATIQAVVIVSSKAAQQPTRPGRRVRGLSHAKASPAFIQRLPDEVLTVVFRMVAENGNTSILMNCSLVCRQWHKLVTPVLWRAPAPLLPKSSAAPSNCLDKQVRRNQHIRLVDIFPVHRAQYGHHVRSLFLSGLAPVLTDRALLHLVRHCPKLTALHLKHCKHITLAGFEALAKNPNTPHLSSLNLSGCKGLCDRGLAALAKHCTTLEEIKLSGCSHISSKGIQTLLDASGNTLRRITLSNCRLITGETVRAIAKSCHTQLEHLDVSFIHKIEDKDLQFLVTKCPNLIHLNVARKKSDIVFDVRRDFETRGLSGLSEDSQQHLCAKWRDRTKTVDMITHLTRLERLDLSHWIDANQADQAINDLFKCSQALTYLRLASRNEMHKKKQSPVIGSPASSFSLSSSSSVPRSYRQRQRLSL